MTVRDLARWVAQCPSDARVLIWDSATKEWRDITGFTWIIGGAGQVRLYRREGEESSHGAS